MGYIVWATPAPVLAKLMRKEVIVAIILGFALGLVITFGIWKANKALKSQTADETVSTTEEETITEPTPSVSVFSLEIISPSDDGLSNEEKITLTGKTQSGSVVTVISEKDEEVLETDSAGNFETEVTLVSGVNEIEVSAFSPEGEEAVKKLSVVYSTAEI